MKGDHVRSIAQCYFRMWVRFNKKSINSGCRCGSCQKRCKLALPSGRTSLTSRLLYGMCYIKNHRGELTHDWKRTHVHDKCMISETCSALSQENILIAFSPYFVN